MKQNEYDFIAAFRNGGCFIFEGEEGASPFKDEDMPSDSDAGPAEATDDSLEAPDVQAAGETSGEPEAQPEQPSEPVDQSTEPSTEISTETAATPEMQADAVNSDSVEQGLRPTPAKLVEDFKKSGNLLKTARYALRTLGVTNAAQQVKLDKLVPFFTKAVTQFAMNSGDNYTVKDITKAVLILVQSCSRESIQCAQEASKAKKAAEAKAKPQPKPAPKPEPAPAPAPEAPEESTDDLIAPDVAAKAKQ